MQCNYHPLKNINWAEINTSVRKVVIFAKGSTRDVKDLLWMVSRVYYHQPYHRVAHYYHHQHRFLGFHRTDLPPPAFKLKSTDWEIMVQRYFQNVFQVFLENLRFRTYGEYERGRRGLKQTKSLYYTPKVNLIGPVYFVSMDFLSFICSSFPNYCFQSDLARLEFMKMSYQVVTKYVDLESFIRGTWIPTSRKETNSRS